MRNDSAHWSFAVLRRAILFLICPAVLGALLLIGLLEVGAAYLKMGNGPADAPVAASPGPSPVLAVEPQPADTLATASTTPAAMVAAAPPPAPGPAPNVPAPSILTLEGPFTILDGRTLATQDVTITLAGIDGPDARAICVDARRQRWACGLRARAALSRLVQEQSLSCRPLQGEGSSRLLSECSVGEEDLARTLVRQGWARPIRDGAPRLQRDMESARRAHAGLWNGDWTLVQSARVHEAHSAPPTP
jgi:endonuclease YncB( thermonuclease family)